MGLKFNIGKHDYNIELSESVPVDISYCSNSGDHSILWQAVDKLFKFNVTQEVRWDTIPNILVPKTDGSQRLVLNLKALNRCYIPSFQDEKFKQLENWWVETAPWGLLI